METPQAEIPDWLREFVTVDGECWLWAKNVTPQGYGVLKNPDYTQGSGLRDQVPAHRWVWACIHGPIPLGLYVCHHCDVRRCVRPSHLFLGTPQDNTRDALAKGRMKIRPKQTHCKRGHLITETKNGTRRCRTCATDLQRRYRDEANYF